MSGYAVLGTRVVHPDLSGRIARGMSPVSSFPRPIRCRDKQPAVTLIDKLLLSLSPLQIYAPHDILYYDSTRNS